MPLSRGFNHVATLSTDLDRHADFYQRVFGAEVTFRMEATPDHPRMFILDLGGGAALNVFQVTPEEIVGERRKLGGRGAIDHFAIAVDSLAELEQVKQRLADAGADIGEIQRLGGEWSLFFRDVDGMELEVCAHARTSSHLMAAHYRAPGWFTRNVFNRSVAFLTRHGVSVLGSRILAVRGRSSGEWRTTPVNLLEVDDRRYLVSPRGETQWVRNLRAAGTGELRLGKRAEAFRARELDGLEQVPLLRAYLARWRFEVGVFFDGVSKDATDEELLAIAPRHPTFELVAPS